jgi:hypothetical protein
MALENRASPAREILADPARGTFMGNRGGDSLPLFNRRQWDTFACSEVFWNTLLPGTAGRPPLSTTRSDEVLTKWYR